MNKYVLFAPYGLYSVIPAWIIWISFVFSIYLNCV